MKKWHILIVCSLVLTLSELAWTQQVVFSGAKARFSKSATNRLLVSKDAAVILDDTARQVIVRHNEHPLNASYDDIQRIVFDVSTHMRGGFLGTLVGGVVGGVVGDVVGEAISNQKIQDYWCYVEYKGPDGTMRQYMLEISRESSPKVIAKMQTVFGAKVTVAEFAEKAAAIVRRTLKDLQSKHDLKLDRRTQPMAELKPEMALVVVVCPPQTALGAGGGPQYKLHANDRVVAVNKMGTYSFAYLDPGDYLLVSQLANASGFRMKLEAGEEYYFLQDTIAEGRTALSRHTKELVMYELNGAYYADWKRK